VWEEYHRKANEVCVTRRAMQAIYAVSNSVFRFVRPSVLGILKTIEYSRSTS